MGAWLGLSFGVGLLLLFGRRLPARSRRTRSGWLARRVESLGASGLGLARFVVLQVGAAAAAGAVVLVVTRSTSVASCFAVFGFLTPGMRLRQARARRQRELRSAWPEVIDNLASAVRAGMSLPEAIGALAERGPALLRPAFGRFAADHRATGQFALCLDRLKADLADPVADRICEALRLAREVGGTDLGRLLRTLSGFLREDDRIRAELETRQGWTVNAARLAVASPWLVLLLLATQSTALSVFDSGSGRLVVATGAAVSLLAYRLMLAIGRLPVEHRVLG
jgi:tight adherence protein B